MRHKKLVLSFCSLFFAISAVFIFILWLVDPLRLYHKPYFCKDEFFSSNMRLALPGLIKHNDFDSIIFGTSMLENTSAKEASQYLGGKFMNLSFPNADYYERDLVLDYLLRHRKIKKILYSLDPDKFFFQRKGLKSYPLKHFVYLYDKNPFNDIKAYLNDKMLKKVFSFGFSCKVSDIDRPSAWMRNEKYMARFNGFENWLKDRDDKEIVKIHIEDIIDAGKFMLSGEEEDLSEVDELIKKSVQYIDDYFLSNVKKYPDIEFIAFIPPHSRLKDSMIVNSFHAKFLTVKEAYRHIVTASMFHKNLKIYGWGNLEYQNDIKNYRDLVHYGPDMNTMMLQYIHDDFGRLTLDNFDEYYEQYEENARAFDFMPYYEQAIKDLK